MIDVQKPSIRKACPAKRRNPLRALLTAALAVTIGVGAFGILSPTESQAQTPQTSSETKPIYFALDPLTVPLNDPEVIGNTDQPLPQHYLKITITFELADQSGIAALQALKPRIVDSFQDYLHNLHSADVHGSDAVDNVRSELLSRVHTVAPSVIVKNVLIQELQVQ